MKSNLNPNSLNAIVIIVLCTVSMQAQIFNRSFADDYDNSQPIVGDFFNSTLLVSTNQNYGLNIRKLDMQGNLSKLTVYRKMDFNWTAIGIKTLQDSSALIYGYYSKGCDILMEEGDFILQLNANLDTLRFKTFTYPSYQFYEIIELPNQKLIAAGNYGLLELNANLDSTNGWFSQGMISTGVVYLGNNQLLLGQETWASSTPFWLNFNLNSFTHTSLPNPVRGILYDLSDTTMAVWNTSTQVLNHLRKSDFSQISQLNIGLSGMINSDVYLNASSLALIKSKEFRIYNLMSTTLLDSGKIRSNVPYNRSRGAAFIKDSVLQVATRINTRQVHLESIKISKPQSSIFPAELKVRNTGFQVLNIDTFPDNSMRLSFTSDWQLNIKNISSQTINNLSFYHSVYPTFGMCLPEDTISHLNGLSLAPSDSVVIDLMDVESSSQPLFSSNVNINFNVRMAQVNGQIVSAGPDSIVMHTVNNVSLSEDKIADFQIYPNPAHDVLMLQSSEKGVDFNIYDSRGGLVLSFTGVAQGLSHLNIAALPSGIYRIELKGNEIHSFQKLIKQ